MSAVFALPAAVRLPRTVAARRALLTAFFLGGFLALAFLFGGGAHAAERPEAVATAGQAQGSSESGLFDPSRADTARDRTQQAGERTREAGEHTRAGAGEAADTTRDTVSEAVRPVREPVERQARKVTDPVGDLVRSTGDSLPVGLPDLGVGSSGGAGSDGSAPGHGPAKDRAAQGGSALPGNQSAQVTAPAGPVAASSVTTPSRSDDDAGHGPVVRAAVGAAQDGGAPAPLPLPRSPLGTVPQYSGDSGAPRGGDTHAALPPSDANHFGLRPGAIRAESSAPTRERFNEVLEFPG
ncbi:hypothetical protein HUT19_23905 [Streptomyces sp. NA02950]|uniref:hypothetical protein n=1 Tax=Streptomyces sp. NA02950 TaxID=2742137 RepID=UPI001591AAA2|nr:hypothetical protein [Streptomyces sp. NA02950]QKV94424.1 hypothetical protein HUT19_23905 [Streptomyces sp. NA02950]